MVKQVEHKTLAIVRLSKVQPNNQGLFMSMKKNNENKANPSLIKLNQENCLEVRKKHPVIVAAH